MAFCVVIGVGLQSGSAAIAGIPASTPAVIARTDETVTADPLPTAQIDGVVYTQVVASGTVFAGGSFSHARPAGSAPGAGEVRRDNLLAYDLSTGQIKPFAPLLNGRVKTVVVSSDKKTLYVGGSFTKVGSVKRNRFAAFDVASGRLTALAPDFNSYVNALAVAGTTVYAGGGFSRVSGQQRLRLAAVSTSERRLTRWAPTADQTVQAMVLTPDKSGLVVGGSFGNINSTRARGMGLVSLKDGKTKTWKINDVVKDYGQNSAVLSLASDQDTIYGTTYGYGGGNFEGVFAASPKDGAVRWLQDCHGDTYSVVPVGDVVYSVGHAHYCSNIGGFPETTPQASYRALAVTKSAGGTVATNGQAGAHYGNFAGRPAPSMLNWFPRLTVGTYTGQSQAAWSVTAADGYLLLGGEFLTVGGLKQQGLVRFVLPKVAPNAQGPVLQGSATTPSAAVAGADSVSLSWPGNYDRDDLALTYELMRDDVVISTTTTHAPFWQVKPLTYTDQGLRPGQTYTYRVRVRDDDGNNVLSPKVTVRLAPGQEPAPTPDPTASATPSKEPSALIGKG